MGKVNKFLANPFLAYDYAAGLGLTNWVPDEIHLKLMYRAAIGNWPDMKCPSTFNEKLQWLKLHDRNPLHTTLADKLRVKEWVAGRIGAEHVAITYDIWERTEDVDISGLPERFVLKTNHDCGGVVICRDRDAFDVDAAKRILDKHLKSNYYWRKREWPYKDIRPVVFAEECLEPKGSDDLEDYKLMCFNGKVRCSFTCTGRALGDLRIDFFDAEWNHLPFTRHYPSADVLPVRPHGYEKMVSFAEELSRGIPFVRVDFYEIDDRLLFGEMTFFPGAGLEEFEPAEWDERLGAWIDLSGAYGPTGVCDE